VINGSRHTLVVLTPAGGVLKRRNACRNSAAQVEHREARRIDRTPPAATMQLKVQVRTSDVTRSTLITDMLPGLNLLPRTNPRPTNRVVTIIGEHAPTVANANTDTGTATKNARTDPVHRAVSRSESRTTTGNINTCVEPAPPRTIPRRNRTKRRTTPGPRTGRRATMSGTTSHRVILATNPRNSLINHMD